MATAKKKTCLIVIDGWGISEETEGVIKYLLLLYYIWFSVAQIPQVAADIILSNLSMLLSFDI